MFTCKVAFIMAFMTAPPPTAPLFPYTTLFRSHAQSARLGSGGRAVLSRDRAGVGRNPIGFRSEEHTSELQSRGHLVCRLLLAKKNKAAHQVPNIRKARSCMPAVQLITAKAVF